MKRLIAMIILALAVPAALLAAPGDMSVATFLAKADALKAQGMSAMFSKDYTLLQNEGKAAGEAYKAQLARERAAGRPSSCPPPGVKVKPDDLIGFLRGYPPAVRPRVSMKQAMRDYFVRKYPCR